MARPKSQLRLRVEQMRVGEWIDTGMAESRTSLNRAYATCARIISLEVGSTRRFQCERNRRTGTIWIGCLDR